MPQKPSHADSSDSSQSRTTKDSASTAAATSGGSQPTETPAQRTVLTAANGECVGEVRVHAFVYPCSDGDGAFRPEFQPLPHLEVTLSGQDVAFSHCDVTDDNGMIVLRNVPADHTYAVSFATPPNHTLSSSAAGVTKSLNLPKNERTTIELGFQPAPATIKGFVFLDEARTALSDGQPVIHQAQLDVIQGGDQVTCVPTDDQGALEIPITCPTQLVRVKPRAATIGGRKVRPLVPELFVMPEPGGTFDLAIPYTPGLGEIRVNAQQIKQTGGEEQRVPLPNVTFNLFRGPLATGTPFRRGTARGHVPAVFGDLDAGMYVLTATPPTQSPPLEAVQPRNGILPLSLGAGQTVNLADQFAFRVCAGSVRGTVLDSLGGDGIAGVPVFLARADNQGTPLQGMTGAGGEFFFPDLQPGEYICSLAQEQLTLADGSRWELPPNGLLEQRAQVTGSLSMHLSSFRLIPEEHLLVVHLQTPDQQPVQHGVVDVLDDRGNLITSITADDRGIATFNTGVAGTFMVEPHLTSAGQTLTRIPVKVNSRQDVTVTVPGQPAAPQAFFAGSSGGSTGSNGGSHNGELKEAVVDLAAYPVLTEASSPGATPSTAAFGGGTGSAPLGQIVESTLRDVLAWRPKATDPKGFLAALNQSFTCTEREGRSFCEWSPRSYAVQADLGAITGAQASIYTRAKALIDQSIPLLDGLEPLRADADDQDVDAERAIVRSNLLELINELGVQGGPIVARVDSIFNTLLGVGDLVPNDIDQVQGQLRSLRDEFGFDRDLVNTVEEEQNLTNFIIVVDNVASLRQSWINQRRFFDRASGVEPFFGTQMVLLSRSLAVISESVHEVYYAMDSVFLDDAERHTVELVFNNPPTRLFISELLGWTDRFASEEAPRLIQDGGKSGVISLRPTLDQLRQLARGALLTPKGQQNPVGLPAGFRTARVQRALEELADHLDDAFDLTNLIQRNDDVDVGRLLGAVQSPQGLADLANQLATASNVIRQLQRTNVAPVPQPVPRTNGR